MATFLVVLPGSSLGCLTACLTFVYSTLEIVKTEYKMHIIAAQSLNGRQPDYEQCRMLYAPCFFVFVLTFVSQPIGKSSGAAFLCTVRIRYSYDLFPDTVSLLDQNMMQESSTFTAYCSLVHTQNQRKLVKNLNAKSLSGTNVDARYANWSSTVRTPSMLRMWALRSSVASCQLLSGLESSARRVTPLTRRMLRADWEKAL
jgi:hypothetical protein